MIKRNFSKFVFVVLTICFLATIGAQSKLNIKSLDANIPLDPKITHGTLDNGLQYYIRENKKPENRADLQIIIKCGSVLEHDNQAGLAHFTEHMCFNGTKHYPKDALVSFLESIGMRFGADLNANTGFDRTYYMITIPMDRPGVLDSGLMVLKDWLHNVTFDPIEIEKERGVIMEEWRLHQGAQERIMRKQLPVILNGSKYAKRIPIGDTAVILHAPRERFLELYNDWYRPDLAAIVCVGDFDKNVIEKKIKSMFSDIKNPSNEKPRPDFKIPMQKQTMVSIATDKEWPYNLITLYFKHQGNVNESFGKYRDNLVSALLSKMLSERLSEKTHDANPPYIFANAVETHFMSNLDVFNFNAMVKETDFLKGMEAMLSVVFQAKEFGFTKTELARAKKEQMRFIEKAVKEKDKTESGRLAQEIARNFIDKEAVPGVVYEKELYDRFIPDIKMSEINSLIKKLIIRKNLVLTVSAPKKEGFKVPSEKELLAVYDKVSAKKFTPYVDKVSDNPLFDRNVSKGRIINEDENEELGMTELTLSNGIKVYLKPTTFKNDEILVQAFSPGGNSQVGIDDYYSASVASSLIDDAGIANFDAIALQKKLSGKIVRINPYIGTMSEGFYGSVSPEDMETLFQLINLYFVSPRKDNKAFQSYITKLKEQLKNSKLDPNSAYRDTVNTVMSSYNPRSKPWDEDLIKKINYDKAFSFYQDRFSDASDFTFIFVGNFKMKPMKTFIMKYIASLPALHRKEKGKDVGMRYPKGYVYKELHKGKADKSSVRLVFTGPFKWNRENRYELQSLTQVLNMKMREKIREDKGGTYGIYSYASPSKYPHQRYRLDIGFGAKPARVKNLVTTLKNLLKDIKTNKVADSYIEKVKEIQIRQREINLKKNRYWLRHIYNDLYNGDDMSDILHSDKLYETLNSEMILKTAKKYLNFDRMAEFILYPEK